MIEGQFEDAAEYGPTYEWLGNVIRLREALAMYDAVYPWLQQVQQQQQQEQQDQRQQDQQQACPASIPSVAQASQPLQQSRPRIVERALSDASSDANSVISYDKYNQCYPPIQAMVVSPHCSDDSSVEDDRSTNSDTVSSSLFRMGISEHDVLCGRGKGANSFIGNRRFRELVVSFRSAYVAAKKRRDKRAICEKIISIIHSRGGRFLEKAKGSPASLAWTEITREKTLVKTSQALREAPSRFQAPKIPAQVIPVGPAESGAAIEPFTLPPCAR
mmetsp:Transcript_19403/g.45145  ORF Transcript_19403/g.45145 Transcript_19403/m.45145 type:complete len:274 (-) Transcript_19403:44-865(-)